MSTAVIVYILTVLAAVVIVLTRLRLAREGGAGRFRIAEGILLAHTVAGSLALLTWLAYLVAPQHSALGGDVVGILAIGLWWVVALLGLLILLRWLPAGGKHATGATQDAWSEGPGLSVLAHVGMAVGVLVFTFAYLTSAV